MKEFEQKTLGDFHLKKLLGTGFFGGVFLAESEMMGRKAVKILDPEHTKIGEVNERIKNESEILERLKHKNIPAFRFAGIDPIKYKLNGKKYIDSPFAYLVMDYIEGDDLEATLKTQGTLPAETVKDYLLQLSNILSYAHKTDDAEIKKESDRPPIYHGDIKPSNIKVVGNELYLLDFGCGRIAGPSFFASSNYGYLTLYTAPELLNDRGKVVNKPTANSDQYSLGMLVAHMLYGEEGALELAVKNWQDHGRNFPVLKKIS